MAAIHRMGRGRIVLVMEDLLRSARALAYLSVLATDAPLPLALKRLQDETANGIRDRTLLTDQLRLLEVFFATVSDWNWSPEIEASAPLLPALAPRLRDVAEELVGAPATASWWQPLDRARQIWVHSPGSSPTQRSVQEDLKALHPWASKPRGGFWTSTAVPPLPSMWLLNTSDGPGAPRRAVWHLPLLAATKVWEIDGPRSWLELCRRYPDDTTQTYGEQWRKWDLRQDRVVTPNWWQVAQEWDGVHLSMGGLLTTEGVPLDVGNAGTMLQGWTCEGTLWLRWAFGPPERLPDWEG